MAAPTDASPSDVQKDGGFLRLLRSWRALWGIIAKRGPEPLQPAKEEDDSALLSLSHTRSSRPTQGTGIIFVLTDQLRQAFAQCKLWETRVLDAGYGAGWKEHLGRNMGIESWGDWEIWIDRIDKTGVCRDLPLLACLAILDISSLNLYEIQGMATGLPAYEYNCENDDDHGCWPLCMMYPILYLTSHGTMLSVI